MNTLALSGVAFGSLALGAVAAGGLVVLTPTPARPVHLSRASVVAMIASSAETSAVATTSTVPTLAPATSVVASPISAAASAVVRAPTPPKASPAGAPKAVLAKEVLAKPLLAAKPVIAAVKRHLANVAALVSPPRSAPRAIQQVDHHYDNVLTASQISRIKAGLRLSSDQEPYWPRVAAMLREVGRRQMAAAGSGEAASFGSSGDLMQFYFAAQPLLRSLRDDQKAEVRRLAHRMGFGAVDSYI